MEKRAYRAIFFDLDGTLLPVEVEQFILPYMKALFTYVAKLGIDLESFKAGFNAGTKAMLSHDVSCSNADAFWDAFFQFMSAEAADWEPILREFYLNEFPKVVDIAANPAAARAVKTLREKGYPLALVTQPMFPPEAVDARLAWAGVDGSVFERITTYDNSCAVKPRLAYYAENLAAFDVAGADVLMVGNNTLDDIDSRKLGLDGYVITDLLINPNDFDLEQVKHSSLEDFANWCEQLPVCENPAQGLNGSFAQGFIDPALRDAVLEQNKIASDVEDGKPFVPIDL